MTQYFKRTDNFDKWPQFPFFLSFPFNSEIFCPLLYFYKDIEDP